MTLERWREIEDLYYSAREHGISVLSAASDDLRHEVERLLAQQSGGGILDRPALSLFENWTPSQLVEGSTLGPYRIETHLSSGGMGSVYRATDTRLGRAVAIKVPAARYSERFQNEARVISTLNHPNICSLYDVGPDYLVMEFIEGSTLAEEIKNGPVDPELVARYGAQIAGALSEAHRRQIVHRDLKPSNIMLTRHGIKVLDFGIAKMLSDEGQTEHRPFMGTPAYMAPEEMSGHDPNSQTDLFALGLVLYEMAVGKPPHPGISTGYALANDSATIVPEPSKERPHIPAALSQLIVTLLEKDPKRRPQSASEVAQTLSGIANRASINLRALFRPAYSIPAFVLLTVLALGGVSLYRRVEEGHWAREEAVPQIASLTREQPLAAFLLFRRAERFLSADIRRSFLANSTRVISVASTPPGSNVEIQDYAKPGQWLSLGTTPVKSVVVPNGYFRWRLSRPGSETFVAAPETEDKMQFTLRGKGTPVDADSVPGGHFAAFVDMIGPVGVDLPPYEIDRFEVTNRQYEEFVRQGGYQTQRFWKEKFFLNGQELSWNAAMDRFRDQTGHLGPAIWRDGHFPPGQADYPVSGVSWYEAAAYAQFAGKSLPTFSQWQKAAPNAVVRYRLQQSNFGRRGPVKVGAFAGVGPYGTYDLNGNVREWCFNAQGRDQRFILGGAWNAQPYEAFYPEAIPPFDRSWTNGIRCVRNKGPLPAAALAPLDAYKRDVTKEKPVSDEAYKTIRAMYAYDPAPLNTKSEGVVGDTSAWIEERVEVNEGYESERLPLYVFKPKVGHPPYQVVVFAPSILANMLRDSKNLGEMRFIDYIIQSGRAAVYPIYKWTYERYGETVPFGSVSDSERLIQQSKEIGRSIDYLETRSDIDKTKIGYVGLSAGAGSGVIFTALEDRFRAVVLFSGGFFLKPALPAVDQVNFAPHLKKPVLMINGRYDFVFSPERAQEPLFRMIGTAAEDKRRVVVETPHDISQDKETMSKEALAWLDKYLGRVSR